LRSIDEFKGCKKAELREVARLAERVEVEKGEILAREGQFGGELFVILSGTVEVTQKGQPIGVLGPGDFFGELGALTRGPRQATVSALSDLGLLIIGLREFHAMLKIPPFRDALLTRMASRLPETG
jgi:CRP-like cAMP-binding protein